MINVTILIPVYNEEATILQLLERVFAVSVEDFTLEVIVIEDGSSDRTLELLESRPDLYSRLIKRPQNGGKGAAVIDGLNEATGDYILFQDADLEYDPGEYHKLFFPITRFEADVVIGSRFIAPEFTRVSYFWHKFGNRVLTFVFNILNNTTFTDIYSCYLVYRRDLVDPGSLKAMGWDQHAEILSTAVQKGNAFYEVPVSYHGRGYEEGKKIRAQHGIGVILTILRKRLTR
ncbi:MAG: Undecaprenyl-phosphate 4-deoxy-4-formamido-L-arabinose transferase [Alphaproteobacteria bacterium MarineAlpha11_Bin1]|nr:MAG: Undecaprenyl-phosphate 4-deoxy-4-formamido-L-arabinose transferase [Alphaproteobacteria bacterium MarineAlpha11_Bin1]